MNRTFGYLAVGWWVCLGVFVVLAAFVVGTFGVVNGFDSGGAGGVVEAAVWALVAAGIAYLGVRLVGRGLRREPR
jgi:hypothetical protein